MNLLGNAVKFTPEGGSILLRAMAHPSDNLRTIPGVVEHTAPVFLSAVGDPTRFRSQSAFANWEGVVPGARQSSNVEAKGLRMTKAGPAIIRMALYQAGDIGRRWDSQLASDGTDFILVEAKGTVFETGNLHRDSGLEQHIKDKKLAHLAGNPNLTSLFGVITGIPCKSDKTTQCLLLDPLFEDIEMDPAKYQLLSRLYYYSRILRVISRGQLVRALLNRIEVLKRSSNYVEFDGLPLIDIYEEPIIPPPENTSSIWNKTVVKDKIVEQMFPISKTDFFYFAIDMVIYRLMVE